MREVANQVLAGMQRLWAPAPPGPPVAAWRRFPSRLALPSTCSPPVTCLGHGTARAIRRGGTWACR